MIILLDLDGTLTDTAHEKFKPYKDGLSDFEISEIPVFPYAIEFVEGLKKSHFVIIVSDSHPKYVNKIASEIFGLEISNSKIGINKSEIIDNLSQVVYLADKPNIEKTYNHLSHYAQQLDPHCPMIHLKEDKDKFLMIGDSWLDIELGRRLNIRTVLTSFYKATSIEERDGIGQEWKPIKMGPTYYAKSFEEIKQIIENPNKNLLALEAVFQGETSENMVRFLTRHNNGNFIAFRCLARQEDGECDRFARADKYYQIDNPERTTEFISQLAQSVTNYLNRIAKFPQYHWDYITYVSDKKTTKPPNKMKEIFELVETSLEKIKLFEWSNDVKGNLRNQPNYQLRRDFISANLKIIQSINLVDKNIIVIDDQFTSSATANEISQQLRNKGVKNILFVSLFYLILPIESKICPKCGKALKIKINKKNGNKFYSCLPPNFGGQGCGFIENIV
jgi:phosphoglycolate phosphatase-like HAD superfamily hydrolase